MDFQNTLSSIFIILRRCITHMSHCPWLNFKIVPWAQGHIAVFCICSITLTHWVDFQVPWSHHRYKCHITVLPVHSITVSRWRLQITWHKRKHSTTLLKAKCFHGLKCLKQYFFVCSICLQTWLKLWNKNWSKYSPLGLF